MITTILSYFAFAGALLIDSIFVVFSTAAVAICFALCACQILLWVAKFGFTQSFVNGSCFWGALTGFIWSIVAVYNLGLWSAFLSVLALCALILSVAWATWMADEVKGHPIPDWA